MQTNKIPLRNSLNNYIDKDMQETLLPLNMVQSFFLIPRYNIRNNFISSINKITQFKTVVIATILVVIRLFDSVSDKFYFHEIEDFSVMTKLKFIDFCWNFIVILVTCVGSILMRNTSVLFIVELQKLLNVMKIDKTSFLWMHKFWNWMSFVSLLCVYLILALWALPSDYRNYGGIIHVVYLTSLMCLDLNVMYSIRILVLLKDIFKEFNKRMKPYNNFEYTDDERVAAEFPKKAIFRAYVDILEAFNLWWKENSSTINLIIIRTFYGGLITVQNRINKTKVEFGAIYFEVFLLTISIFTWTIKNVLLLGTLCATCENFYEEDKVTHHLCTEILAQEVDSDLRKICKNILRRGRIVEKPRVCGACALDAAMPPRVLAAIVTYVVVLLQFAFL